MGTIRRYLSLLGPVRLALLLVLVTLGSLRLVDRLSYNTYHENAWSDDPYVLAIACPGGAVIGTFHSFGWTGNVCEIDGAWIFNRWLELPAGERIVRPPWTATALPPP